MGMIKIDINRMNRIIIVPNLKPQPLPNIISKPISNLGLSKQEGANLNKIMFEVSFIENIKRIDGLTEAQKLAAINMVLSGFYEAANVYVKGCINESNH